MSSHVPEILVVVATWPADNLAVLRFTRAFSTQENLKLEQENQRVITMLAASAKSENRGVIKDILGNLERLQRDKAKVRIRIIVVFKHCAAGAGGSADTGMQGSGLTSASSLPL